MTKAYDFKIKNSYGETYKPTAKIFLKNAGWYKLPSKIKFLKGEFEVENSVNIEIFIDNEELKSVLDGGIVMHFTYQNDLFKMFAEGNRYFLQLKKQKAPERHKVLNFLTSKEIFLKAVGIIKNIRYSVNEKNLKFILCTFENNLKTNEKFSKSELQTFALFVKEVPSGVKFIERFIKAVQDFFIRNNLHKEISEGDFTTFRYCYDIKRASENTLGEMKYGKNKKITHKK